MGVGSTLYTVRERDLLLPRPGHCRAVRRDHQFGGEQHKVILQNRVNMQDTEHVAGVNYFVNKNEKNIRPYGILFQEGLITHFSVKLS